MVVVDTIVHAALNEGAVVVTPNRRLARILQREFDRAQRAVGRLAWPTPSVLPYPIWLEALWDEAVQADARGATELLLSPPQSAQLWRDIVTAEGMPLLDPHGAAGLAAEAWALAHEWGAGGESWRAWRRDAGEGDDAAVFARWAEAYRAQLQRAGAQDLAQVPGHLIAVADRVALRYPATILAGFTELSPQQERLCAALVAAGGRVQHLDTLPSRAGTVERMLSASPRAELVAALDWARLHAEQEAGLRIGIVVEDLAARRDEVVALAVERLCPAAFVPASVEAAAPFEVSLGIALATVPLVVAALDLITLAQSRLQVGVAAALLRSPYLPAAAEQWTARAGIERGWLQDGRRDVMLGDAIAALETSSPTLARAWREGGDALRRTAASPREWVDLWRSWLVAAGWPGSRPLDSGEYQAREAWERMLGQFASLGAVSRRLAPSAAQDALRALAGETIFQPEGSGAPIQILGVLESTGMTFDALWVAGLTADRWPPAPAPNPLLPIAWQRERNVPRASAARELAYATLLTARFARAAAEVTMSSAANADDHALAPSALILSYPERPPVMSPPSWLDAIGHSATLETIADLRAPRLAEGSVVNGGARIVAAQSDCPFQAMARHRLDAEPWPVLEAGLSRLERGQLLHATLAHFWMAVTDHAALCALSATALDEAVAAAAARALTELSAPRWRNVPAVVRANEARRLGALVVAWLALERERAPFAVREVEAAKAVELGGLTFRLRLDRVDELAKGGLAILDYKSGRAERPARWFDTRPQASQLGLYTLAQRMMHPELAVHMVAYAQLKAGAIAPFGLAKDTALWPGLAPVADVAPGGTWPALEAWWQRHLGMLATEILHGHAAVTPRESPSPCRACGLYAVCRIQSARELQDDETEDE